MATFNSSSFLVSSSPTDKVIRFKNIKSEIINGFNVCTYESITFEKNLIWVTLKHGDILVLDFPSESDTKLAFEALSTLIESLYTNCVLVVPGPPASSTVTNITKGDFDVDRLAGDLVPNSVYVVQDISNNFGLSIAGTFQLIPLTPESSVITGVNLVDNSVVTLNFTTNKVVEFYDSVNNNKVIGNAAGFMTSGTTTNISFYNSVMESFNIDKLDIKNSSLSVVESSNLVIENCSVTLTGVENSYIYGIIGTYSDIQNCIIDPRNISSGKNGRETLSLTDGEVITAFKNTRIQEVQGLSINISKVLTNYIPTVATQLIFKIPTTGIGAGYSLTLLNEAFDVLFVIQDKHAGQEITLTWDVDTASFKVGFESLPDFNISLTVLSDGQTIFSNVLPYDMAIPARLHLFVNGNEQTYGTDYTVSSKSITWLNNDFSLETSDTLKLYSSSK